MTDFCQAEWERKEAAASSRAAALQESNKELEEALEEGKGKVKVADAAAKSAESRCFFLAKVTIPSLLAAPCSTLGDVGCLGFMV
jgi:HPt (histidine-containing phosphotransfer) domain-containing protein